MKAYSLDLRERVVSAYEDGVETIREVAEQFLVSESLSKRCSPDIAEAATLLRAVTAADSVKDFPTVNANGC